MEDQIKETPTNEVEVSKLGKHNQIILANSEVVNFDPDRDVKQGQKAAKALMKVIEITKPLKFGGKTYLYFEHWQTIAKFFNATVGTEWTKKVENGYEAKATVYQNGQTIGSAEGSCLRDEVNWKSKPDFQLRSMAQTRAMAKALRSIFGYIPVLAGIEATPAEEMNHNSAEILQPEPLMSNAQNVSKPISKKQALFINALRSQKGLEQISDDELRKLNSEEASAEIKRLQEIEQIEINGDYPQ